MTPATNNDMGSWWAFVGADVRNMVRCKERNKRKKRKHILIWEIENDWVNTKLVGRYFYIDMLYA